MFDIYEYLFKMQRAEVEALEFHKGRTISIKSYVDIQRDNEMLQEVIRNYKIIGLLNLCHTASYIMLQRLQYFTSENWTTL